MDGEEHLARLIHPFSLQMAKFRATAKLTQSRYGANKNAAGRATRQDVISVAAMATQSARISTSARPGIWRPKKTADQPTFSTSWIANHRSASQLTGPPLRQTSHPATAITA